MQKFEKSNLREKYASYKKMINMFSVQFCELVLIKKFWSTFVDLPVD